MSDKREGFTTLYNPETGDAWGCPDGAVEYWTSEKKWRKSRAAATPKKSGSEPANTEEKG
jgi:hypothetical protein